MRWLAPFLIFAFFAPLFAQDQHPNKPIRREPLLRDYRARVAETRPQVKPMLFSPEYQITSEGKHTYGWSFMTQHPDSLFPILVTAHHHFTRKAGLQRNISARDLPKRLQSFSARSSNDASFIIKQGNPLFIPQATSITREFYNNDLAAILLFQNYPEYGAELRQSPPQKGEQLWLLAAVAQVDQDPWFIGHVSFIDETGLEVEMQNADLVLRSVTGSPLIDKDGKVAGMLLMSTKTEDGKLYLMAISGDQIYKHISLALKRQ